MTDADLAKMRNASPATGTVKLINMCRDGAGEIEKLRYRVSFLEGQAQAALELELSRVVPVSYDVHLKEPKT